MIYHTVRLTLRPDAPADRVAEAVESLRNQGRVIPSVTSFVVGRDVGGEFEWGATYVIEDLDGYWQYLKHPAHRHTDEIGLPLTATFVSFDVTDDPDPRIAEKIADLHRRRYEEDPALTKLVSDLASYSGSSSPEAHAH
ncbi:Dabb family protein [Parafrankia sp. FMc2]|uniref:Dabb family protein n=1 Tax=Parafrankia sp. FMc2 TaxID=3233196 RepID=UPI0034D481DD